MSLPVSHNQVGKKRSREIEGVFDTAFSLLMKFADDAETIVQNFEDGAIVAVDDPKDGDGVEVEEEEEEPLAKGGGGDATELFLRLPVGEKEQLLKDVFGEIVGSMLGKLPHEGKDEFLVRCFDSLFLKLSNRSRGLIGDKVVEASSQTQESPPRSPLAIPSGFDPKDLVEAGWQPPPPRRPPFPLPVQPTGIGGPKERPDLSPPKTKRRR